MAGTKIEYDAIYGYFAGTNVQNDAIVGVFAGTTFENAGTYHHSAENIKMRKKCRHISVEQIKKS